MPDLKPPSYTEHFTIFADLLGFEEAIGTADDSLRLSILKLLTDLQNRRRQRPVGRPQQSAPRVLLRSQRRPHRNPDSRWLRHDRLRPGLRPQPDAMQYVSVPSDTQTTLPPPGLPFSLVFRAEPGKEDVVLRIAAAYEAASKRRIPPPAFGPPSNCR
jgi:hypothetical protein